MKRERILTILRENKNSLIEQTVDLILDEIDKAGDRAGVDIKDAFADAAEARDEAGFIGTPAQCIRFLSAEVDRLAAFCWHHGWSTAPTPPVSPERIERINGGKGVSIELGTSEYDWEAFRFENPYPGMVVTFGPDGLILRVEIEDLSANLAPPPPGVSPVSPEPNSRAGVEREKLKEALAVIEFAQTIDDHYDMREFLNGWSEGDTEEWPEFAAFLAERLVAIQSAPTASAVAGPVAPLTDAQRKALEAAADDNNLFGLRTTDVHHRTLAALLDKGLVTMDGGFTSSANYPDQKASLGSVLGITRKGLDALAVLATQMAEGCCSAVSPCSHQQRDPYSLCSVCKVVQEEHRAGHPRSGNRCPSQ